MKFLVVSVAVACFAQSALSGWIPYHGEHHGYHGPLAKPVVLHTGFLADTPEVAHAKEAHLKLVPVHGSEDEGSKKAEEAEDDGSYKGEGAEDDGSYKGEGSYDDGSYKGEHKEEVTYHGPLAKPVVLHTGFLADTPEVAHAKEAHLKLVSHHGHGYDDGSYKGDSLYHGEYGYASVPDHAEPVHVHYDDGSYKGEGAYHGEYGYASVDHGQEDDGSYKYEHGHY